MCDPIQELSNLGGYVERGFRGFNDAIDSGIRGVGGSIEEAAPYIIAAVALYYGIPPEAVTGSEIAAAGAEGAITAEQVATASASIGMAGEAASGVLATAGEIAAAQGGVTGLGTAASIADQFTLPGNVMNIASSQPGVWDQFVNSLSTPAGVASALKTGAGLTGLFSGISSIRNPGISPQSAQTMADPFAPSRQQYINQLNAVMANPSLTMSQPGYQFQFQEGLQGLNRNLAKRGMGTGTPGQPGVPAAGGAGMAQQRYGQQYAQTSYNDYVNQLAGLAGAKQNPSAGATAGLNAQEQAQRQAQKGWGALGESAGALSTLFGGPQTGKVQTTGTTSPVGGYSGWGSADMGSQDIPSWNTPASVPDIPTTPSGWQTADMGSQDVSPWWSNWD
jgi:hypothetical protein